MADEQKQPWHKSIPGWLTAATGFIAALSGLVAGLNQLGVFKREPPAQQVVGLSPAARESAAVHAAAPVTGGSASSAAPGPASSVTPPAAQPTATPPAGTGSRPTSPSGSRPTAPSGPRPTAPADTGAASTPRPAPGASVLPKGTTLELTVSSRTCAPVDGQKRFTARLVAPVKLGGTTVLPASTTAVLRVRRAGSPAEPQVRVDSLVTQRGALAVTSSQARVRREAVNGACIRPNGRIVLTLGSDLELSGT